MSSGLRRLHTKSRNGCSQCKKRKVKCDQQGPCCGNCRRRGQDCHFEQLGDSLAIKAPVAIKSQQPNTQPRPTPSSSNTLTPSRPLPLPADVNLRDLELMHHYSTSTSMTLAPGPLLEGQRVWQIVIPNEAQSHKFLMSSILAISALHIAHLRPSTLQVYTYIARAHYGKALVLFRSTVSGVTPANCTATLAFSMLLVFFSCGLPLISDGPQLADPIDSFINVLSILRGPSSLFQSVRPWVSNSPMTIMSRQARDVPSVPHQQITANSLDFLEAFNSSSTDLDKVKGVYRDAILQLRRCFGIMPFRPKSWAGIISWPVSVSREYFMLLQQKRPMALVILTYWCIPMHHAPNKWFMANWAEQVVYEIWRSMDAAWKPAMEWPAGEIGILEKMS